MHRSIFIAAVALASSTSGVGLAAPAIPREPSTSPPDLVRIFLDVKGNGFDLGTCSAATKHRGPPPAGDDRILAIDVAAAAKLGFRIAPLIGSLGSAAAFGTNLRVTPPTGTPFEPSTGWAMFAILDTNKDGILDASDLVWPALRVAQDLDGDGRLDGAEVAATSAIDLRRLGPRLPNPVVKDANKNELALGSFNRADTSLGSMADVRLASCDVPASSKP